MISSQTWKNLIIFLTFVQVHHSSEEFNLTTAFRQPILEGLGNTFIIFQTKLKQNKLKKIKTKLIENKNV